MPFVDRELPADFEIRPIAKRKSNLPPGPGPGRPKGCQAKIVRDLKEGVITAAENIGDDGNGRNGLVGYLEDLGRHHKRAFASLLVKLLPMQGTVDHTHGGITQISIVSVPADQYLTRADADRLSRPGFQIEHEATQEPATDVW